MSDDNEHERPVFLQMGPPPEVIERHRMEGEANAHETREFFESLTEAQLRKFASMMGTASSSDGTAATYYLGVAAGILDWKFHLCLACGKNHDKPFEEMATSQDTPLAPTETSPEEQSEIRSCCGSEISKPHTYECRLMIEYSVEPDDNGSPRVMCRNCGMWYVRLEDRMLRKAGPGGCEGCIQKTKWG